MKLIMSLLLGMGSIAMYCQGKPIKKPEYVIIIDGTISSQEELQKWAALGYIKSVNKGVDENQYDVLVEKFGERIADKEFVVVVELLTEEEKLLHHEDQKTDQDNNVNNSNNEFKVQIGNQAPDFEVEMVDGITLRLNDLKGKVIMLNFWATWCAPCILEFYDIPSKILEPFGDKDFVLIPVSIGENRDKVQKRMTQLREKGIDFNVGIDPDEKVWKLFASGTIPKNIIIDKNGKVHFMTSGGGEKTIDVIADEIRKLL